MHDRVAEVLAQRATLDRGAGLGVVLSILFHAALMGGAVYTAFHATPPEAARMVSIQFAPMPAAAPAASTPRREQAAPIAPPKIVEPKIVEPKIVEPKPVIDKKPEKPPEKNTVPLSPFGQSTKKGSEAPAPAPAPAPPPTANRQPPTATGTVNASDVPLGGSGITGIEGGDFPHALYLQGMHRRIGNAWIRPNANGLAVVIYFRILRDGTIADARVATPSGNPTFDRAALSAVRSSSPLNPLPFAYTGKELGLYLTFR